MTEVESHLDLVVALLERDVAAVTAAFQRIGNGFGAFARRHQIAGYLYSLVRDAGLAGAIPPPLRTELEGRYRAETRKRALLHAELGRVLDAFGDRRIECILVKGPQLSTRFYGGSDRRVYWDLDLLVRHEDLAAGRRLLEDSGYQQQSSMLFGERLSMSVTHALDYARGDVTLDLHWRLVRHPSFRINYERLWKRSEPWTEGRSACRVLSPDYELTLNLLSSLKDIERGAFRIRSLVDLWMILSALDADADWNRFFSERDDENVREACAGVLELFLVVCRASARFPRVAQAVRDQRRATRVASRSAGVQLIAPGLFGPARRVWTTRLYRSPVQHVAWWMLTLPVRLNVHKPGKMKRLTNDVRTWLQARR